MKRHLTSLTSAAILATMAMGVAPAYASTSNIAHVAVIHSIGFQDKGDGTGGNEVIVYTEIDLDKTSLMIEGDTSKSISFPFSISSVPSGWNAVNASAPLQYAASHGYGTALSDHLSSYGLDGLCFDDSVSSALSKEGISPSFFGYKDWEKYPVYCFDPSKFTTGTAGQTGSGTTSSGSSGSSSNNQKSITLNGKVVATVPGVVHNNTTYMPIWYIQHALTQVGIQSSWNGTAWLLTTSKSVNLSNVKPGNGPKSISINGKLVQKVDGIVIAGTTYMPIWYVQQILTRVNIHNTWDGHTWSLNS